MFRPLRAVLLAATFTLPATAVAQPARVLLLDYNAPDEHDVLISHLCVERCTRSNGCPEAYVSAGVDSWSEDFVVYRPRYLGQSAELVVRAYADDAIDLLSFSGHHASGFSGDLGRGQFRTEMLSRDFEGLTGLETFFTSPEVVLLHGCRTDVKSRFDGDPVEYVRHVMEETTVREDEFERLLAAVQQIGGVQEAYRELFPNACILGYRGTQTPGGLLEIYGQIDSLLRKIANVASPRIDLGGAYGSRARGRELVAKVDAECPRGWPCNLCRTDPAYYRPLAAGLARLLRAERYRVHSLRRARPADQALALETLLESGSFYANSRWACSTAQPGAPPVWPDPVDESPFGLLFLRLMLGEIEGFTPAQQALLEAELLHRLGTLELAETDAVTLRAWIHGEENWPRYRGFLAERLPRYSTFRQRDFFAFLAGSGCSDCLEAVFTGSDLPSILRENAASQLRSRVGPAPYRLALRDPDVRVRRAALARVEGDLLAVLEPELLAPALPSPPPPIADEALPSDALAEPVLAAEPSGAGR